VRPAALVLPPDVTFKDAAKDALKAQADAKPIWL
jgi:hypothetical protein